MIIVVDFENEVIATSYEKAVVMLFTAKWDGPSHSLKSKLQFLESQDEGEWLLAIIDVEELPSIKEKYKASSIPTILMLNDSSEITRMRGSEDADELRFWLETNLPRKENLGEYQAVGDAIDNGDMPQVKSELFKIFVQKKDNKSLITLIQAVDDLRDSWVVSKQRLEKVRERGKLGRIIQKFIEAITPEKAPDLYDPEKPKETATASRFAKKADKEDQIEISTYDSSLMASLVLDGINAERRKVGAEELTLDPILNSAALDHNNYQIEIDELTHEQKDANKKNCADRIKLFGGGFRTMGENVQYKGFPIREVNGNREILTNTYKHSAEQIVYNWVNSPGHYANLINKEFRNTGLAIGWNPENASLFATQVFGTRF